MVGVIDSTPLQLDPSDAETWPGAPRASNPAELEQFNKWRMTPSNWNNVFDNPEVKLSLSSAQASGGQTHKPFRLRVQQGLAIALRQIHPHNGFWSDLTHDGAVVRGRLTTTPGGEAQWAGVDESAGGADSYEPQGEYVTIVEEPFSPETDLPQGSGSSPLNFYALILQGTLPRTSDNPTDPGQYLLADVRARLAALKIDERHPEFIFRMGSDFNAVSEMHTDGGVVRVGENQSPYVHFWLSLFLQLTEDAFRPMM